MSEQVRATQLFYNRWAGIYDRVATAPGLDSWRTRTAESLSLSRGDTVVEMGCGTGANFPHLREAVGPEGTVVGVDLVDGMLVEARRRIDRQGWSNVHALRGDATRPPVGTVDAVAATFLVGMIEDPPSAVRTWIDCIEQGGRITIMNAGRSDRLLATPLNVAFRGFVRLAAPGGKTGRGSPARELEARWETAKEAVFEATVDHIDERMGAGFVVLASGRVPD